jgi:long-chain acyl-CoA synthetase
MPTFYERFVHCADRWPENIAVEIQRRSGVESHSYSKLRHMAESIARWLAQKNLEPGARVAILANNDPRWVASYLGILASGCTVVPLDTALNAEQVAKPLRDSGSVLLFCDSTNLPLAQKSITGTNLAMLLTDSNPTSGKDAREDSGFPDHVIANFESICQAGSGKFVPVDVNPDSLAVLLYTSGTTADPKGVMLTHANLVGEAEAVFRWAQLGPSDAVLGVLPMFHVLAQMANLLLPLACGARVVYLETLNTTELLRALQDREITAFAVVPQFFYLIHERILKEVAARSRSAQWAFRALMKVNRVLRSAGINAGRIFVKKVHSVFGSRMRYLVTGGSRFDPQIARDFHGMGIDVLQAYGLSETAGAAFANSPRRNVIGSVGPPLPGVKGKIIDPQPQEEGGPPVGEIAISGPIVMKGYWNRPDATAAVLKEGWLHTGDLGYFDAHGNLFITGRKKELIILSNGKNIYPEEIEAHYLHSLFIKEICVMALEARAGDPASGRLHAVIVPNFELLKQRKIVNSKEVIRFDIETLSAQLPTTKRIGSYEIWQHDLPRTTTRKLKRFEIEKLMRAGKEKEAAAEPKLAPALSAEDSEWLEQPDVRRALDVIRRAARSAKAELRPDDNLELDLGLDSMQRIELLVELEQELGGDVEESRLAEIYTVRELVEAVRESSNAGARSRGDSFRGWKSIVHVAPDDPEVLALVRPRSLADRFWYLLTRIVLLFAHDRFHLRVAGLQKLPARGPYIICSNHQGFLDPVILMSALPWHIFKRLFAVGTSEIFGAGFMRMLARWLRVVVLDPDANLVPAMRAGAYGLQHELVLMLYPEGERSIDGTPKVFRKGAAILSIHMQAPIVPLAIEGFYEAWPRGKRFFKFAPLRMKFGDAIYPPPESDASEAAYEKLTAELRERVVAMWNELRKENAIIESY